MKKILMLGGTGAMGIYLSPELLSMGYKVDVVSLDASAFHSDNPHLQYIQANAMDDAYLADLLRNEYDGIVDFLTYVRPSQTLTKRLDLLLQNTGHYIQLSSYRVYGDREVPITERAPRLLDYTDDAAYLSHKEDEYSLYKALGEDILTSSAYKNWSIVRPAITYSSYRYQLVTMEANIFIHRMRAGQTVLLPESAMPVFGTMSWAGDVARMIARLTLNSAVYGETYTVATAEHHTWQEIADMYARIGGLKYQVVPHEDYLNLFGAGNYYADWQLKYDRLSNRIVDNSKILTATGMKQSELMPLYEGLKRELSALPLDYKWAPSPVNEAMDAYLSK